MVELTPERLREMLNYDPQTGVFTWNFSRRGLRAGAVAGGDTHYGYRVICVDRNPIKAHHLAWFWHFGMWPKYLDHVNGNRKDNRIENLREVTHQTNMQNIRSPKAGNKSGYLGVSQIQNRWRATLTVDRKSIHLGLFDSAEEAHQAYLSAKRRLHEGCTI